MHTYKFSFKELERKFLLNNQAISKTKQQINKERREETNFKIRKDETNRNICTCYSNVSIICGEDSVPKVLSAFLPFVPGNEAKTNENKILIYKSADKNVINCSEL